MNKKAECDIVKDLATLHIENMLSTNSEEFVEKHLLTCEECKEYYNDMNSNIFDEKKVEKNNDQKEINHLKKVNKKMKKLKWTIAIILWGILAIILIMYLKMSYINNIIGDAYSKIYVMSRTSGNYKLICKEYYSNANTNITEELETTYFYKDGKNKEVMNHYKDEIKVDEKIKYVEDYGYKKITVFPMLKKIDYQNQDFIEVRQGDFLIGVGSDIARNNAGINNLGIYAVTDNYGGKECWVIKNWSKEGYTNIYIEKETKNLLRVVECYYSYYREKIFVLEEGVVTDKDVDSSILNTENYRDYVKNEINYIISDELKESYE